MAPDDRRPIAWVETIAEADATGALRDAYSAVAGSDGRVENLYRAMSQTPGVIRPADDHYRALLHDPASPLAPWLAELVSTHVAVLCGSEYAWRNHGENFEAHFGDRAASGAILAALHAGTWRTEVTDPMARAALAFAEKLTLCPADMAEADIAALRTAGFGDKAIGYLAQLAASFAYWSRIINALGIRLGETIGVNGAPAPEP